MSSAYQGFPADWLSFVLCHQPGCGGALQPTEAPTGRHLMQATIRCTRCDTRYPLQDGILRLLDPALLNDVSNVEREQRDQHAHGLDHSWEQTDWVRMEMVPTLRASAPLQRARVLELGAGTGRYSVPMARQGAQLLAVDFSFHSLRTLAQRVEPGWDVALIEADCTALRVQPGSCDLVASTLISNLPTAQHRESIYRLAASALRAGGKFVFSAHHFSWRSQRRGLSQAGTYKPGGIYRYLFEHGEIRQEVKQYFAAVDCRPVQIHVPVLGRYASLRYHASRVAERIWPLNRLGDLLLVAARKPVRSAFAFVVSHLPVLQDLMPLAETAAALC